MHRPLLSGANERRQKMKVVNSKNIFAKNHDEKVYNVKGEELFDFPDYENPDFGTYHPVKGYTQPHWDKYRDDNVSDLDGFDKTVTMPGGDYKERVVLPKGFRFARFGGPVKGYFGTVPGTEYEKLGLPYKKLTCEYHVYEVLEDIEVDKGIVAPIFNSKGGGDQFKFFDSFQELLIDKKIKDVTSDTFKTGT